MNFATEDEVMIYSENSEDESNDAHRTATSAKVNAPGITAPVVNISTTQDPQESGISITKVQLESLENELFGKVLAFKSSFMDEILSLKDEIKAYKINDNMQELFTDKSEELILLTERKKYLKLENKFLKDDIFNKQKRIDKLLENNNKLVNNQSHHVPVQYIQGSQSGYFNGRSSLNGSKYKPVDNNSLSLKLGENKNSSNKKSWCYKIYIQERNNDCWRFYD